MVLVLSVGQIMKNCEIHLLLDKEITAKRVEKGEYTFVLTPGIARGNAELTRVDFTIQ